MSADAPEGGPAFVYVERAYEVGSGRELAEGLLLVRVDERTYRRPAGAELVELHRRHPNFVRSTLKPRPRGEDEVLKVQKRTIPKEYQQWR